jgi:hypothetical protein
VLLVSIFNAPFTDKSLPIRFAPVLVSVEPAKATKVAAEPKSGATALGLTRTWGRAAYHPKSVGKNNKIVKFLSFCIFIPLCLNCFSISQDRVFSNTKKQI